MTPGRPLRLSGPARIALGAGALYFLCFAVLSVAQFEGFHSRSYDLAISVRMLWGLRHAQFHEVFTDQPWLAFHFEPILLPLALLDAVLPPVNWLLCLQTAALALAAWPAYRMGARVLGSPRGGALAACVLLVYPVLSGANLFEFHPVALAVAPGLALLDALDRRAHRQAWLWAALTAACREDGFNLLGLALLSVPAATRSERMRRLALAGCAFAAYGLYVGVVQPRWGSLYAFRQWFGGLGATPGAALGFLLTHPGAALRNAASFSTLRYLLGLLAPLGFLPLLAPRRALPALWTLTVNVIGGTTSLDSHFSALAIPGLFVGALYGAARLRTRLSPLWVEGFFGAAALVGLWLFGAGPLSRGFDRKDYAVDEQSAQLATLIAPIQAAPAASCSVPLNVIAHVAQRPRVLPSPRGLGEVDFALVDLASPPVLGSDAQSFQRLLHERVAQALGAGMRIVDQQGSYVLLRR
ncbi:MAG TPA: DUF2079 domain-containing protein [Polyangia bacterium]|nr:DUF2079 domain-containing protein [Polyangia bacterium]